MFNHLRNLYHPERFHLQHRLEGGSSAGHFEGWYFKFVDAAGSQPYAIIPGVFLGEDSHAFIQVLDGRAGTASYHRFPLESFRASPNEFAVEIAGNHFSSQRLNLKIDAEQTNARQSICGSLEFSPWRPWPVTWTSPGVMGPYSFVPFMECNHGILSLDHAVSGALHVDGRDTLYDGGSWLLRKRLGPCLSFGLRMDSEQPLRRRRDFDHRVGREDPLAHRIIPEDFSWGFLLDDELHRFTTYTGATIESLTLDDSHLRLRLRNRKYRIEMDARKEEGGVLHAPYGKQMIERVAETMRSEVELRFSSLVTDTTIYQGRGQHACLEVQGDLPAILDA